MRGKVALMGWQAGWLLVELIFQDLSSHQSGSMHLIPKEVSEDRPFIWSRPDHYTQIDKLVISQLGLLAQRRLARGVKLNHSEATVGELGLHDRS